MAGQEQIIELYTQLAHEPQKDFGWDKGLENAHAHAYQKAWIDALPAEIWDYCAAVGNPFQEGIIRHGDTVLDLGCGAGVDLLVSSLLVGAEGKVIGVDMTPAMVEKAKEHVAKAKATHVKVMQGSIEKLDLEDESIDVVISNGAINLAGCKEDVFSEMFRVLKPGAILSFADMIDTAQEERCCSTQATQDDWANCVAGTLKKEKLLEALQQAGFVEAVCHGVNHYQTSDTTFGATFTAKKPL
jgi:ubiquinone/menaquinone biosynthesis C-methylase UbiE